MTEKKHDVPADVYSLLGHIQANMKAPKTRINKFAGYNFRNCEDIFNAVKPFLVNGAALTVTDDIVMIGDRVYVKAIATLYYKNGQVQNTAFAREPLDKKGSDPSQITGATSSYARKYSLNGLFLVDDTQDADETNDHGVKTETKQAYSKQRTMINEINACKDKAALVTWYGANERDIDELPAAEGGMVRDQYEARATAFDNGVQVSHTFKFGNVEEQNAWMSLIKGQIEGCDSVTELAEWQEANKPKLMALEPKRKSRVTDLISVTLQRIEAAQKQINQPQV